MKVALFFDRRETLIAVYDNSFSKFLSKNPFAKIPLNLGGKYLVESFEKSNYIVRKVPSSYLLQNPQYFKDRLISQIISTVPKEKRSDIEQLTFAVDGLISPDGKVLIESQTLNEISYTEIYNGLNAQQTFSDMVNGDKIRFIPAIKAICAGIDAVYPFIEKPCLVIYIHKKVSFAVIDENGYPEKLNIENWLIEDLGGCASDLLGNLGVDEILQSDEIQPFESYTMKLIKVIRHFHDYFAQMKRVFKTVYIFSEHEYLIDYEKLSSQLNKLKLFFPRTEKEKDNIPVEGSFRVGDNPFRAPRALKVEYWNQEELVNTFTDRGELLTHWRSWGRLANQTNTYRVYGQNGLINIYRLSDIKYEINVNSVFS